MSPVRIDTIRTGAIGSRGAARSGSGVAFHVNDGAQAQRAGGLAQSAPAQDIGSLLALQAVEDPTLKKKKLVRRGNQLLDTLDEIKAGVIRRFAAAVESAKAAPLPTLADLETEVFAPAVPT